MLILYLEALVAIVLSLSILMALAWVVQQRTGNSGWVDTIWTFSLGLVGAGSALWPIGGIPPLEQHMLRSRRERYRDDQSRTSMFFPLPPPQKGVVT
jgi:steroid 5-alpha reductase family enzyme